jgi:hypothetical protein
VAQLISANGPYEGTAAASIPADGAYAVSVQASGPWSAMVSQPDLTSQTGVRSANGSGDAVVYVALNSGVDHLHITNSGSGPFVVSLYDPNAQKLNDLVSQTGNYDNTISQPVSGGSGVFAIAIRSNGRWTLTVQ